MYISYVNIVRAQRIAVFTKFSSNIFEYVKNDSAALEVICNIQFEDGAKRVWNFLLAVADAKESLRLYFCSDNSIKIGRPIAASFMYIIYIHLSDFLLI